MRTTVAIGSWIDPDNFDPGYLVRSQHLLPSAVDQPEWPHSQDDWIERDTLPAEDFTDGCLNFSSRGRQFRHGTNWR